MFASLPDVEKQKLLDMAENDADKDEIFTFMNDTIRKIRMHMRIQRTEKDNSLKIKIDMILGTYSYCD